MKAHAAIWCLALLALEPRAFSKPESEAQQCIDAHDQGEDRRQAGALIEARERFARCSKSSCPAVIREDCAKLATEVTEKIPSLVVSVRDEHGRSLSVAQVRVDDRLISDKLDGLAHEIDPGRHRIAVELPEGRRVEKTVVLDAGSGLRRVDLVVRPDRSGGGESAPVESEKSSGAGQRTLGAVVLGAGAIAIGAGSFFWLKGKSGENDLAECKPCPQERLDDVHRNYVRGDYLIATGAVAAGIGAYFLLTAPSKTESAAARRGVLVRAAGAGAALDVFW